MTKTKKILIAISSCMCLVDVFYNLFFNIYIMENVTSNIVSLFLYYLIGIIFALLLYYPFFKILNKKTAIWLYRISFVFSFVLTILSMLVNSAFAFALILINALRYIFCLLFYVPHEIETIHSTTQKSVPNFLAWQSVFSIVITVVCNLFVSYLFDFFSIYVLLSIILIDVVVMFVLSMFIPTINVDNKFEPKKYFTTFKKYPHLKNIYTSHFFKRMAEAGVVSSIIPIMLYMKLGSGFSIGIYASIASVCTAILLPIFVKLYAHKHTILIVSDVISIIMSILLIFLINPVVYIIYYFINKIVNSFFSNAEISTLFGAVKYNEFSMYDSEHVFTYGVFGLMAEIISYVVGIVVCILAPIELAIPIIITIFMIIKLISILYLLKADKSIKEIKTELTAISETNEPALEKIEGTKN